MSYKLKGEILRRKALEAMSFQPRVYTFLKSSLDLWMHKENSKKSSGKQQLEKVKNLSSSLSS